MIDFASAYPNSRKVVDTRFAALTPGGSTVPLEVPMRLVHGTDDKIVPFEQSRAFASHASEARDDARVVPIEGAGHFDVIAPDAPAFEAVEKAVRELLGKK